MSDDLDPDAREIIRRRIALRERDGHERLLLNHEALRALLDTADERDRLARDAERWHLAYVGESIRVSELEAELADRGSQCNR